MAEDSRLKSYDRKGKGAGVEVEVEVAVERVMGLDVPKNVPRQNELCPLIRVVYFPTGNSSRPPANLQPLCSSNPKTYLALR